MDVDDDDEWKDPFSSNVIAPYFREEVQSLCASSKKRAFEHDVDLCINQPAQQPAQPFERKRKFLAPSHGAARQLSILKPVDSAMYASRSMEAAPVSMNIFDLKAGFSTSFAFTYQSVLEQAKSFVTPAPVMTEAASSNTYDGDRGRNKRARMGTFAGIRSRFPNPFNRAPSPPPAPAPAPNMYSWQPKCPLNFMGLALAQIYDTPNMTVPHPYQRNAVIPKFVHGVLSALDREPVLRVEGLFRLSGNPETMPATLKFLAQTYDPATVHVDSHPWTAHDVANLFKRWLRELPEHMFPESTNWRVKAIVATWNSANGNPQIREACANDMRTVVHSLELPKLAVLSILLHLCARTLEYSSSNLMTIPALARVIAPNLFTFPLTLLAKDEFDWANAAMEILLSFPGEFWFTARRP
ncbi:GTPase activating protein (GAP) for Rho1p [Blastocladiella emersonii ATCC 22665]|nr:GTPase activating protein (GAP) for Rho1p [Blastocladiella emersonii ATCC 22665]